MLVRRIAFIPALALGLVTSAAAALHTHLVKAEPAVDGTVSESPAQVRLWFSERPEVALSSAIVLTSDSAPVARIAMSKTDDSVSVAGPLTVRLKPGKYLVVWKTGAPDGHVVRGSYGFSYTEAGGRP